MLLLWFKQVFGIATVGVPMPLLALAWDSDYRL